MNNAFIFDMDGVIIDSEPVWERYEQIFLPELLGKDVYAKIKDQILGNSVSGIYKAAVQWGFKMTKKEFEQIYDRYAEIVYEEAKFTDGIQELVDKLISINFTLGLVSSSRQYWINLVFKKLGSDNIFRCVLSLDSYDRKPKPFPDGYLEAINLLGSVPEKTIILEDSNRGIQAAKASGAFTICLQENLPKGYLPPNADKYVTSIRELIQQIESITI